MTTRANLETLLNDLGLRCAVLEGISGFTVDTYPVRGHQLKESDLDRLTSDIAGRLKSPARVSFTDNGLLALELAASKRKPVSYADVTKPESNHLLPLALGKTNQGKELWLDLAQAPHLLIAGTTGSGKSNWLSSALAKLISLVSPEKLQVIAIDPKKVELAAFKDCPHLLTNIITQTSEALQAVAWLVSEMNSRYDQLAAKGLNNISQMATMPRIVLIIDELAQLFSSLDKDDKQGLEGNLQQLTQLARAVGIHCVLATQKPSSQIFSSIIKANVPYRIAFKSLNHHESIAILEQSASQNLLGHGDGLFLNQYGLTRFQAPLIDKRDISKALATYGRAYPLASLGNENDEGKPVANLPQVISHSSIPKSNSPLISAEILAKQQGKLTASLLIDAGICGKNKANNLMKQLRDKGVIGAHDAKLGFSPLVGDADAK